MKTPREILLSRHQAAEPKLDALRDRVVATLAVEPQPPAARSWLAALEGFLRIPRPVLGGLAAVWLVILALSIAARDTTAPSGHAPQEIARTSKETPKDTRQALREQKRLFAELVGALKDPEAETPRFVPRPRGQLQPQLHFA